MGTIGQTDGSGLGKLAGVDLNLLVALDALLQERNVTRAGERLSLSQPTMSGSLARLRVLFDDGLLIRSGRTMHLTPLGASLQATVREILSQIEQVVCVDEEFDPQRATRTFTLMASDYAVLVLLRPVREVLEAEAPGVHLRVQATGLPDHAEMLQRGEIDLAIVPRGLTDATELPWETAMTDRFVVAVWKGNSAVGPRLTMRDLRDLPYLSYGRGSQASTMVDAALQEAGLSRQPEMLVESFLLCLHMVRGTRQVTFLQERLAQRFAGPEELRLMDPPFAIPSLTEVLTWHPRANDDPSHRWLRTRILEIGHHL